MTPALWRGGESKAMLMFVEGAGIDTGRIWQIQTDREACYNMGRSILPKSPGVFVCVWYSDIEVATAASCGGISQLLEVSVGWGAFAQAAAMR